MSVIGGAAAHATALSPDAPGQTLFAPEPSLKRRLRPSAPCLLCFIE